MWHFLTLSILPKFEETHTGDLIKICSSLWIREDALMWTEGREWIFYLLGIWWFYFRGAYQQEKKMLISLDNRLQCLLCSEVREPRVKQSLNCFHDPVEEELPLLFNSSFLCSLYWRHVDSTEQQITMTPCSLSLTHSRLCLGSQKRWAPLCSQSDLFLVCLSRKWPGPQDDRVEGWPCWKLWNRQNLSPLSPSCPLSILIGPFFTHFYRPSIC